jgi:hypothetical protein
VQIGSGRAFAPAIAYGHLHAREAILLRAVVIIVESVTSQKTARKTETGQQWKYRLGSASTQVTRRTLSLLCILCRAVIAENV